MKKTSNTAVRTVHKAQAWQAGPRLAAADISKPDLSGAECGGAAAGAALRAAHSLGVVFFPAFDWAISPTHPEREERLLYTQDQLLEEGLFDIKGISEHRPDVAEFADVERVHFCLPSTEAVCSPSHLASAGGAIRAGRLVMDGQCDKAFALVRPPGHHAMRVSHGNRGFCNVNIEAVMLAHLRAHYRRADNTPLRVAVVDTDCHHGDGSQDIFWNDPDTLFISLHQDGRTLYPGTGFIEESGGPAALGRTVNIPLPPETGDEGYLYTLEHAVLPLLEDFKPDLVINSAGQDNHFTDPLANMRLTARGYAALTRRLNPHIAVLEGGYAIRGALPYVNLAICLALAGLPTDDIVEPQWTEHSTRQKPDASRHIESLCKKVVAQYMRPPQHPTEGQSRNGFWSRHKNIFYDTDMLAEEQNESFKLCPHCVGYAAIESASRRTPLSLCVYIPERVCEHCRQEARSLLQTARSSGKYHGVHCIEL